MYRGLNLGQLFLSTHIDCNCNIDPIFKYIYIYIQRYTAHQNFQGPVEAHVGISSGLKGGRDSDRPKKVTGWQGGCVTCPVLIIEYSESTT